MNLVDLGDDILFEIISFIPKYEVLNLEGLSRYFQKLIFKHPFIWKEINIKELKKLEFTSKIKPEKVVKFFKKIQISNVESISFNIPIKDLSDILEVVIYGNKLLELDIGESGIETIQLLKLFQHQTSLKRLHIGLYEFMNGDISSYGFRSNSEVLKLLNILNQRSIELDINVCPFCLFIFHIFESNQSLCQFCSNLLR